MTMARQTKLAILLDHMRAGDWSAALALAAKFPRLGEHKAAIVGGHEALHHGDFYRQLGKDPNRMVDDGIAALRARYGHLLDGQS
jgi:hypothetical protein